VRYVQIYGSSQVQKSSAELSLQRSKITGSFPLEGPGMGEDERLMMPVPTLDV
jgi:hypothetical protein